MGCIDNWERHLVAMSQYFNGKKVFFFSNDLDERVQVSQQAHHRTNRTETQRFAPNYGLGTLANQKALTEIRDKTRLKLWKKKKQ